MEVWKMEKNDVFYKRVLEYRNSEHNPYGQLLGFHIVDIQKGYGRVEIDLKNDIMNSLGFAHGGVLFSLADSASGAAAASRGTKNVTLSGNLNFVHQGRGFRKLIAEARSVHEGKTISVYNTTIHNENGELIAEGSYTYYDLHIPLFDQDL
jgi:acyl-CoA thioesterase